MPAPVRPPREIADTKWMPLTKRFFPSIKDEMWNQDAQWWFGLTQKPKYCKVPCYIYPERQTKKDQTVVLWKKTSDDPYDRGINIIAASYNDAIRFQDEEALKKLEDLGLPLDMRFESHLGDSCLDGTYIGKNRFKGQLPIKDIKGGRWVDAEYDPTKDADKIAEADGEELEERKIGINDVMKLGKFKTALENARREMGTEDVFIALECDGAPWGAYSLEDIKHTKNHLVLQFNMNKDIGELDHYTFKKGKDCTIGTILDYVEPLRGGRGDRELGDNAAIVVEGLTNMKGGLGKVRTFSLLDIDVGEEPSFDGQPVWAFSIHETQASVKANESEEEKREEMTDQEAKEACKEACDKIMAKCNEVCEADCDCGGAFSIQDFAYELNKIVNCYCCANKFTESNAEVDAALDDATIAQAKLEKAKAEKELAKISEAGYRYTIDEVLATLNEVEQDTVEIYKQDKSVGFVKTAKFNEAAKKAYLVYAKDADKAGSSKENVIKWLGLIAKAKNANDWPVYVYEDGNFRHAYEIVDIDDTDARKVIIRFA